MKKTYLITAVLLLSVVWVAAQQTPSAPQPADANATQTSSANPQTSSPEQSKDDATIVGCLASSNNSFTLTDKAGKTYQLEGDSAKLSPHVGHEIQVIGSQSSSNGTGSADGPTVVTVKKIKMLASSCSK